LDKKENFIKKHDREKSTNTNMVIKMDIVVILQLLSVLVALIVALILCWQIIRLKEEFKGKVLFNALNSYIAIQKDRSIVISEKNPESARNYYREMFDLHWTEFNLWRKGYIDDYIMIAWLHARRRNYEHDTISTTDENGNAIIVSYKKVWESLIDPANAYFIRGDPFITFMEYVHADNIPRAIREKTNYKEEYVA